jgi:hypothetical protein
MASHLLVLWLASLSWLNFKHILTNHWDNLNRPYDQARTLNDLGQILRQAEDTRQAQTAFNQALGIIETLAGQLEDIELKSSFPNSLVVQEIRVVRIKPDELRFIKSLL